MPVELLEKKLEQLSALLGELRQWLAPPFETFLADSKTIRASERNFELIIEIASDINAQLILQQGGATPDTYRASFEAIQKLNIISLELSKKLIDAAKVRNILVHEYDFEEDYKKFYHAAKRAIPAFEVYLRAIHKVM